MLDPPPQSRRETDYISKFLSDMKQGSEKERSVSLLPSNPVPEVDIGPLALTFLFHNG